MKSKTIATMNHLMPSKWGSRGSAIPLLRIATDPRTWVFAGAAAAAGGRALSAGGSHASTSEAARS